MLKILSLNRNSKFIFRGREGMEYKDLKSLYEIMGSDGVLIVRGFFTKTGNFGKQSVLISDNEYVNLPAHLNETVELIMNDDEMIEEINNGAVGCTIYKYTSKKYNKECYSINFVGVE